MAPTTADIRKFLTELFSDEDLTILCYDYFRDVHDDFALGMSKGQKIQRLIERCDHREAIPSLLAALSAERAAQYNARFGAPVEAIVTPTEQPRHVRDPRQIFISHAHEDAEFAHRLASDLGAHGWRVWIAPDSIRPGEKWVDAINRGLEACGVFLVALTPTAVASRWVTDETNVAKEMQQEGELRFIPLGVADCRVPPLWRVHQRISFAGRYEQGLVELLAALDPQVGRTGVEASAGSSGPRARAAEVASPEDYPPSASQPAVPRVVSVPTVQPVAAPDLLTLTTPIHIELVRVPAGEFLMGSDPKVDKDASSDEQPQQRLILPDFYIGKYPVTNEQYVAFVTATRPSTSEHWSGGQIPDSRGNHPATWVSWNDAVAFCQ